MKTFKIIFSIFGLLSSLTAAAQVPEFNASTSNSGKVLVDEDFDPSAGCKLCREMYKARHDIKKLDPQDDSQLGVVTRGHEVMMKALLNLKSVQDIKSENAALDYNLQLILLFDRLDRSDDSPTAVERMAAYVENPEAKAAYKEALSKLPETIRNRVLNRIDEFNRAQEKERRAEKARKPSSATAR